MKKGKRIFAVIIAVVIAAVYMPGNQITAKAETADSMKISAVKKRAYNLSKKGGTYKKTIKVKLTAKNGYQVYYTVNGKFSKKRVLKNGKSKKFTIDRTTTITLYISKKAKTAAQLKTSKVKKASVKYVYKIKKNTDTDIVTDAEQTETTESTPSSASDTQSTDVSISGDAGNPEEAQKIVEDLVTASAVSEAAVIKAKAEEKTPAVTNPNTTVITCLQKNASVSNMEDDSIIVTSESDMCVVEIMKAGTYILTGGTQQSPAENVVISVDSGIEDTVHLVLNQLVINNSKMGFAEGQDVPVITIGKKTKKINITLIGASSLTGNGGYTKKTASGIIYAEDSESVLTLMTGDDTSASLTIQDGMDLEAVPEDLEPTDGISTKGTLVMQSGTCHISVNGDCLKGTGSGGEGGIMVLNGTYELKSMLGNGMKSKNGTINIYGGTVKMTYTAEDGINAKNYAVNITGGDITIGQCYGDGIQGENVLIGGEDTKLDITTCFANAGKNYYNTELGNGNYNSLTVTDTTKEEIVNVDTGSHKGIKAGTKACTYSYQSVGDGSSNETGKTYTKEASGGIIITGGEITIDTTNTGVKYNGGMGQNNLSGNIAPANNDGQYIIGAPDDAVHSNHILVMTGGTLRAASADDGVTAGHSMVVANDSAVNITECYEGMEAGNIIVGSTGEKTPQIIIYSNDDGVNAASKAMVSYDYTDESEAVYTKKETAAENNTFYMLDGYLSVMIGDDKTHSFSLPVEGNENTTGSFNANGDGIDCNGSFYAYGGTVIVYGTVSNDNSPVDTDKFYYIGSGVTILTTGNGGMTENPTGISQASITCGSSGFGQMEMGKPVSNENDKSISGIVMPGGNDGNNNGIIMPDRNGGSGSTTMMPNDSSMPGRQEQNDQKTNLSVDAGTAVAVLDNMGNTILAFKTLKSFGYFFYSSPLLVSGSTYTISSGGSVGGSRVYAQNDYDYRYTDYLSENAQTLLEVNAEN